MIPEAAGDRYREVQRRAPGVQEILLHLDLREMVEVFFQQLAGLFGPLGELIRDVGAAAAEIAADDAGQPGVVDVDLQPADAGDLAGGDDELDGAGGALPVQADARRCLGVEVAPGLEQGLQLLQRLGQQALLEQLSLAQGIDGARAFPSRPAADCR